MRIKIRNTGAGIDVERRTTPPTADEHAELRSLGVPSDLHAGFVITASAAGISLRELVASRKRAGLLNARARTEIARTSAAAPVETTTIDPASRRVRRLFPRNAR